MQDSYAGFIDDGVILPQELKEIMGNGDVKIIDASFVLPTSPENPHLNYQQRRIGEAAFFDIHKICDQDCSLPHMLPSLQMFEAYVSGLGISNDDLVVIYGQSGMVMGPARAWWMFRVFGHYNVCILNGGLPLWARENYPLNSGMPCAIDPGVFNGGFRVDLVLDLKEVKSSIEKAGVQILDARPAERFSGKMEEPRAGMRSGHMPGSVNIPCMSLIDQETGMLRSKEELREILGEYSDLEIITTCGSGVTACVIALAFHALDRADIPVYDGSWSEYGLEHSGTVVKKL